MRSGRLRRSSRVVATLLLVVSLWQLPHGWQDDEVCAPVPEAHDESKHVFTTAKAAAHEDHCAVCHWTRLLKPVFASTTVVASARGARGDIAPYLADTVRAPGSDRLPPRAPPSGC